MNQKKIQKLLREFAKKRDWEQFHNLQNLAISISLESSELLEVFQWDKAEDIDLKLKKELRKISDEVADIMLYLLRFQILQKLTLKSCLNKIKKNKKNTLLNLVKEILKSIHY